jgi:hypothetical protein
MPQAVDTFFPLNETQKIIDKHSSSKSQTLLEGSQKLQHFLRRIRKKERRSFLEDGHFRGSAKEEEVRPSFCPRLPETSARN